MHDGPIKSIGEIFPNCDDHNARPQLRDPEI